jgi:hypothetical protein
VYICYLDESGDDGFPATSSDIFVLTSLALHFSSWKELYNEIYRFRKRLKHEYGFPVNFEFHTKEFLLNKNPYRQLNIEARKRKELVFCFFDLLSELDIRIFNSVVNKSVIRDKSFNVLKTALEAKLECIDVYIRGKGQNNKFLIITDEGRIGKMVHVTRKIHENNAGHLEMSTDERETVIHRLIEDPLPKSSRESYFIQISDMVAYVVYLYLCNHIHKPRKSWSKRLLNVLNYGDEIRLLDKIDNILEPGLKKYGVIINPAGIDV